jgi:DNA-binding transcriptional MerR regulator
MNTVTTVARRFNVSADTVRHYTKLGLLAPERDAANSYRRYGLKDERRLRFLLSAKKLGFSLKDSKQILDMAAHGSTPCQLVRHLIDQRLETVRQEMQDAQALLKRMESASKVWSDLADGHPSGESICHLIENWDDPSVITEHTIPQTA